MTVLSSLLFSAAILLFGIIIGTAVLRNGSREMSESMKMPIIGGSGNKRQGPWPECIGKSGSDCVDLIESYATDVRGHVSIVPADAMVTMDFSPSRVRVFVDADGIVQRSPSRG